MLIVSDAKASRASENYRQYINRRLGAFLAITLRGTTYKEPAGPELNANHWQDLLLLL